jgi:Asp-tRNA(Asn)/Glu-tRNA(Gln) amidotransferase A subunit family amidase
LVAAGPVCHHVALLTPEVLLRISRAGILPLAFSLDHAGPMARKSKRR